MRKFHVYRADQGYNIRRTTLRSVDQAMEWAEDHLFNWTGPDHVKELEEFVRRDNLRPGMDHRISSGCIIVCAKTE